MKKSKMIALSAITTAISVIILVIGAYFPSFDLSCMFLASVAIMVILSKKSYLGAVLAVAATGLLTLFLGSFRFQIVVPYVFFFGFHPIVNSFFKQINFNKYIGFAIKYVWFTLMTLFLYFFANLFTDINDKIGKFIIPLLIIADVVVFFIYDNLMFYFQKYVDLLVGRLHL